jgi:L,D-peptidoglycan transpeptidase YkuD (ErfK/YbiS/YcfS/YnhG family)
MYSARGFRSKSASAVPNRASDVKKRVSGSNGGLKALGLIRRLVVTRAHGHRSAGRLQAGAITIPCSLGRHGVTSSKREGDGETPAGRFRVTGGYWRQDRLRRVGGAFRLKPITADMGWCDDPADANYNRPLRLPARARHEELLRADGLYDVVLVLDHNQSPRVRGHGSAIFFHLTRDKMDPTAGCVAISRAQMLRLLPRLARDCVMIIR